METNQVIYNHRDAEKNLIDQIQKWHRFRDLVVKGEILFSSSLYKFFDSRFVNEVIAEDLSLAWLDKPHKLLEFKALLKSILDNASDREAEMTIAVPQTEMENNKYAKAQEFETPKLIKVLAFQKLKEGEAGVRFVNQWGFTTRLVFVEHGSEQERFLEVTSYGFYKDISSGKPKGGDVALIQSVVLMDPRDGKSYRRWVYQPIREVSVQAPTGVPAQRDVPDDGLFDSVM